MNDTPTAGRFDGRVHLLPVRVYYEDTDFSGLVYHASYLRFLERGRSDFLRAAGVEHAALLARRDPLVFALRRMEIEFLSPARIDDALIVRTEFLPPKGARLPSRQTVLRDGEALVTARGEAVCLSPEGRPRRLPKDVDALIAPHLAS